MWNKWNKHHANNNVVDRLWAEISQELKCEGKQIIIIIIIIINVIIIIVIINIIIIIYVCMCVCV